jgi:hypothetical protein
LQAGAPASTAEFWKVLAESPMNLSPHLTLKGTNTTIRRGNMRHLRTALAGAAILALSGAAMAQTTTAPGGSAERNMNNPGSVKSNSEKGMPERDAVPGTGPASTGTVPGTTGDPRTMPNSAETAPRR